MTSKKYQPGYLLQHQQQQLIQNFEYARERMDHPGIKGECYESLLRNFLKYFFPKKYDVGSGIVIAKKDNNSDDIIHSKQTDIIIYDSHNQPLIDDNFLSSEFIIEFVYAAGEVKGLLNTKSLQEAIKNSKEFKKLKTHHSEGTQRLNPGFSKSYEQRFQENRPYFLFAYDSKIPNKKISTELEDSPVDAVFILKDHMDKSLSLFKSNAGVFDNHEENMKNDEFYSYSSEEHLLQLFSTWLFQVMPNYIYLGNNSILSYLNHKGTERV